MNKRDRIAFVKAGLEGYARLSEPSKKRTSKADWIALKLSCSIKKAEQYVKEAEADAKPSVVEPESSALTEYSVAFERHVSMTYTTEVWALDKAQAIKIATDEANMNRWTEGDIVDEKKPIVRERGRPQAVNTELRRRPVSTYTTEAPVFDLINVVGGVITIDLGGMKPRELHIMIVRVTTIDAEQLGLTVDVVDDEMRERIAAWVQDAEKYTSSEFDIRPDHYEEWAREHKVWL